MKKRSILAALVVAALVLSPVVWARQKPAAAPKAPAAAGKAPKPLIPLSLENRAMMGIRSATQFLLSSQKADGSWAGDPAITALVAYSMMLDPVYLPNKKAQASLQKALDLIASQFQADGSIARKGETCYTMSVCLMALAESNQKKYQPIIAKAKAHLIGLQFDEAENIGRDNPYYGGVGYGSSGRPDMSNTMFALTAIRTAEAYEARFAGVVPSKDAMEKDERELGLHWQKALVFLARCQNAKGTNDQAYATDDGGFMYETGTYRRERSHSYGSMTYAGVMSLLWARVGKDDARVKKAVAWIKSNYTVEFNPGFGTDSLYYYYYIFAKSLDTLGEDVIVDAVGQSHRWREDLVNQLMTLQKSDGSWQNPSNRYWENMKELATAYSVIAMKYALRHQAV